MFELGIPAPRGKHRCSEVPDLLLVLFLQKNLSRSEDRSGRAGPACRSNKVSTKRPRAAVVCGLSPWGAIKPPCHWDHVLLRSPGPEDPTLHLQHQHVPEGGGRHPARP